MTKLVPAVHVVAGFVFVWRPGSLSRRTMAFPQLVRKLVAGPAVPWSCYLQRSTVVRTLWVQCAIGAPSTFNVLVQAQGSRQKRGEAILPLLV